MPTAYDTLQSNLKYYSDLVVKLQSELTALQTDAAYLADKQTISVPPPPLNPVAVVAYGQAQKRVDEWNKKITQKYDQVKDAEKKQLAAQVQVEQYEQNSPLVSTLINSQRIRNVLLAAGILTAFGLIIWAVSVFAKSKPQTT